MAGVGNNVLTAPLAHRERLRQLVDRMLKRLRGGARVDRRDFYKQCLVLAKSIDYVIASNQTPHSTKELLQLFKQVCSQKDDTDVRPAIIVLMLSIKGAMQSGWFNATDNGELFATVKLISDQIGDDMEIEPEDGQILLDEESALTVTSPEDNLLSSVLSRYFPRLKIRRIILSVKAKPGYEILMSDFQIRQQPNPDERLHLFVIRKDNIETSTCLVTPPHVNILINGYGVDQRHTLSNDQGPQLPSDCTPMLKVGANFLQVIGNFQASHAIALASTTRVAVTSQLVHLGNHVLPSQDLAADDELREGPSRISLHCPISRKRMVTPVKGVSCKHLQSFDFDNYLAINERRPSWRCPYCNMHTNCLELRYDQLLGKILAEIAQCRDVSEILISQDGSWVRMPSSEHADKSIGSVEETENMNVFRSFIPPGSFTSSTETCLNGISTAVVDLTQDDQDVGNTAEILMESQSSVLPQEKSNASNLPMCTVIDQEDRKPNLELIAALGVPNNSRADAMISHDQISLRENIVSEGFGSLMQSSCGSQGSVLTFATAVSTVSQIIEGIPMVNYTSGNVAEAISLEGEYRSLPDSFDAASLLYNEHNAPTLLQQQTRVVTDSGVQDSLDRQSPNHLIRAPITLQALPAQGPLSHGTRVRSTSPNWSVNASSATIVNVNSIQATAQVPLHILSNQPTSARSRSGEEFHLMPTWHQQLQHDLPYRSIHSSQFETSPQLCAQTQGQVFQRLESPIHFQQAQTITTIQHPTVPTLQRPYVEFPRPAISRSLSDPYHQPSMHSQQLPSFPQQLQQLPHTYYDPAYWRQQRLTNNTNVSSGTHLAMAGRTSRVANIVQGDRVFVTAESSPLSAFRAGAGGIVRPSQVQLQDGRTTLFPDGSSRLSTAQSNMTAWVAENRTVFPASSVSQLIGGQAMVSTDQNWRPVTRMRGSMSPGVTSTVCVATAGTTNEPIRNTNRVDSGFQSSFSSVPSCATMCMPSVNSLEYPFIESPTNVNEHGFLPLGLSAALPRHQTAVRPGGTNLYLSIAESLPQRMLLGASGVQSLTSSSGNSSATFELAALNDFLFSGIEPCTTLPSLPLEPNFN